MILERDLSVIVPSISSVSRQLLPSTGSLGSVPPLHWLLRAARTSCRPSRVVGPTAPVPRFVSFARRYRPMAETTGSLRFLENPRVHAALYDPGRTLEPGH